jgi:hypothetical protein
VLREHALTRRTSGLSRRLVEGSFHCPRRAGAGWGDQCLFYLREGLKFVGTYFAPHSVWASFSFFLRRPNIIRVSISRALGVTVGRRGSSDANSRGKLCLGWKITYPR